MQAGDISGTSAPRLIYVFEHTLGTLKPVAAKKRDFHLRLRQWKRAARCWEIDPHIIKVLIDVQYRSPYNVDIATYTDADEADEIEATLVRRGVPHGNFIVTTVEEMSRVIANQPHIAAIYDFDPSHRFTFGGKSRSVVGL